MVKVYVTGTVARNSGSYNYYFNRQDFEAQAEDDKNFAENYPYSDDKVKHVAFELEVTNQEKAAKEVDKYWNERY